MQALPVPRAQGRPGEGGWCTDDDVAIPLKPHISGILAAFDGERDAVALEAFAGTNDAVEARRRVVEAIQQAEELGLLGEPDLARLPIYALQGTRYRCLACGAGCRHFEIGPLMDADIARLQAIDTAALGVKPQDVVVRKTHEGVSKRFLRKEGGVCVFLDRDTNLCRIHARFGAAAKPLACQSFPTRLSFVPGGLRMSLYSGCMMRHATFETGPVVDSEQAWVREMIGLGLSAISPMPRWSLYLPELATVDIAPGRAMRYLNFVQLEAEVMQRLRADQPVFSAFSQVLRWLWTVVSGDERPANDEAQWLGRAVFAQLCQAFGELASREDDPELGELAMAAAKVEALPKLRPEAEAFARSLLLQEIWALRTQAVVGSWLPGLALAGAALGLAVYIAEQAPNSGVGEGYLGALNRAHYRVIRWLQDVDVGDPGMLLPFARAPFLPATRP